MFQLREEYILVIIFGIEVESVSASCFPDLDVIGTCACRRTVYDFQRRVITLEYIANDFSYGFEQFLLFGEDYGIQRYLIFLQNSLGRESACVVQPAQCSEPRVRHDDIARSLLVQFQSIGLIVRVHRDKLRVVVRGIILHHKHHLARLTCEFLFGSLNQLLRLLLVIEVCSQHHNT